MRWYYIAEINTRIWYIHRLVLPSIGFNYDILNLPANCFYIGL